MPSRMKFRAAKLRMPFQFVVWSFDASRSSNENVVGSDFTSQYRRSPGARGVNTAAHAPPSFFGAGFFAAGFFAAGFFAAGCCLAVPVAFVPVAFLAAVRFPLPAGLMSLPHHG